MIEMEKMAEEVISTPLIVTILKNILDVARAKIIVKPSRNIEPGLVLVCLDDNDDYDARGIGITVDGFDEIRQFIFSTVKSFADSKTKVVMIVFGAAATMVGIDATEPEENKLGFVLRAITIDGRTAIGFLPLHRDGEDGVMTAILDAPYIMEFTDPFDDDLMEGAMDMYANTYNEAKTKKGEVLH